MTSLYVDRRIKQQSIFFWLAFKGDTQSIINLKSNKYARKDYFKYIYIYVLSYNWLLMNIFFNLTSYVSLLNKIQIHFNKLNICWIEIAYFYPNVKLTKMKYVQYICIVVKFWRF